MLQLWNFQCNAYRICRFLRLLRHFRQCSIDSTELFQAFCVFAKERAHCISFLICDINYCFQCLCLSCKYRLFIGKLLHHRTIFIIDNCYQHRGFINCLRILHCCNCLHAIFPFCYLYPVAVLEHRLHDSKLFFHSCERNSMLRHEMLSIDILQSHANPYSIGGIIVQSFREAQCNYTVFFIHHDVSHKLAAGANCYFRRIKAIEWIVKRQRYRLQYIHIFRTVYRTRFHQS